MDTDSEREPSSDPNLLTSSNDRTFHCDEQDDDDSSVPEYGEDVEDMRDVDCGAISDVEDYGDSDDDDVVDDDDADGDGRGERACLLVADTNKVKRSRRSRSKQRVKRRAQHSLERVQKNPFKSSQLSNKKRDTKQTAEDLPDEDEEKVPLTQKQHDKGQQELEERNLEFGFDEVESIEQNNARAVQTVKVIKISGNLGKSSEDEEDAEEPFASLDYTIETKDTNETAIIDCNVTNSKLIANPSNGSNDALQVSEEIDAQCKVHAIALGDLLVHCAVGVPTITATTHTNNKRHEDFVEEIISTELVTVKSTTDDRAAEKAEENQYTSKAYTELEQSAEPAPDPGTSGNLNAHDADEKSHIVNAGKVSSVPCLLDTILEQPSIRTISNTSTGVAFALADEENWRDSVRESIECYYSAQDLLEYGHLLSSGLKTPDIESGYFEKSESDISRDENEVYTNSISNKIRQRSFSKPYNTQLTNMSESLRFELNRFKSMIESIERERIYGQSAEARQDTFDSAMRAEESYNEDLEAEVAVTAEAVAEAVSITVTRVEEGAMDIDEEDEMDVEGAVGGGDDDSRGYWSTIFGQASQIEEIAPEMTLDERFADIQKAHRALELLEDYHSRLSEPRDRALRIAIERVIRIFKSRLFQALLARDFMQAYRQQSQCIQSVVKMLQQLKEENWCLAIMYTTCLDLRVLAQKCEELGSSSKPGEILEKAADCLMSCFRVCAADNRSADDDTKRLGMLNLVNQLFKVYFRINKLHLCKPLIRAIDSSTFKDSFPLPEQITYKYFVGRKAMFDSDYKSADEFLSFALRNCPRNFPRNKRLILIYLVPVKMLLGYLPKKHNLERFDLLQFHELAVALKEGNVRKFDEVIQRHEIFFIKCGIYLLVEKLKFIVYRNLFKRVYIIKQTHQLDLRGFQAALQFVGETDMSIDETHCIVANLIFEGKIKGYISYSHNKLVVSKQNPFPPLNTVS